ncbi:MAG: rod shape-determining protein MreC [Patescibacteria group bacterium]
MEFSRTSKTKQSFWVSVIALAALTLVLFFSSGIRFYIKDVFVNIFAPHPRANLYSSLSKEALIDRLLQSDAELSRVKYQGFLYGLLLDENANLRKVAGAAAIQKGVTGRVVARPPQTSYDTLLIDIGKDTGIHENELAVYEGMALGRVVAVSDHTATVALFSTSGIERDVIVGDPRAVAVAKGQGGGAFELSLPQSVKVVRGDIVRFQGTESLMLGVVESVSAEARDASQTVLFALPVSFADLDFIRIISE